MTEPNLAQLRHVNSDTYARLPSWQRQQVDAVANILRSVGAYKGSHLDAQTDAAAIVLAAWAHLMYQRKLFGDFTPDERVAIRTALGMVPDVMYDTDL